MDDDDELEGVDGLGSIEVGGGGVDKEVCSAAVEEGVVNDVDVDGAANVVFFFVVAVNNNVDGANVVVVVFFFFFFVVAVAGLDEVVEQLFFSRQTQNVESTSCWLNALAFGEKKNCSNWHLELSVIDVVVVTSVVVGGGCGLDVVVEHKFFFSASQPAATSWSPLVLNALADRRWLALRKMLSVVVVIKIVVVVLVIIDVVVEL
jgi:hypothetical protein